MKNAQLRRAFTLVELLVVIAIIGTLVGLLLPAVQMAREAARKAGCSNNLHQIGIAQQTYYAANGRFPWGGYRHYGIYADGVRCTGKNARCFAWSAYLLPYLEQENLFQQLDFDQIYSAGVNDTLAQTRLPIFICPSSMYQEPQKTTVYTASGTKQAAYGLSHYGGIYGECIAWEGRTSKVPNNPPKGVMLYSKQITNDDIEDGLSNTLIVGEDSHWADGQWISSLNVFEQSGPINASVNDNELRSDHPGGANAVFCDGHTRLLNTSISLEILSAVCTRAGWEIVNLD